MEPQCRSEPPRRPLPAKAASGRGGRFDAAPQFLPPPQPILGSGKIAEMPVVNSGETIQVGDWTVTPSLDSISRGNETQKLEPRTMRLLMCLVDSAGAVVSVDHLLTEVWVGVVVGPASVYQAVSQLRKLLHDVDPEPTYIVTVPRKGYRLIAAVRRDVGAAKPWPQGMRDPGQIRAAAGREAAERDPERDPQRALGQESGRAHGAASWQASVPARDAAAEDAAALEPSATDFAEAHQKRSLTTSSAPIHARARWRLAVVTAVVLMASCGVGWVWLKRAPTVQAEAASIVVLPFVDMTAEKTGQPFCDGLTEELSNWLSQIPTLRVVARTSAFAFRGAEQDVRDIGKTLDTNHVLEGSMRRSGDHMRVTVQLIDARNGYHLWSANYDKPVEDTIRMQEDISRAVAQVLQIRLTSDTNQRFAARRSENSEAYQLYLSARYYQHQRTRESNDRAIELYKQVLAADPKFALAYVGLSYSHLNQRAFENRPINEIATEIEPLISTALRLEPHLAEAYTVRAALRSDQIRIKESQQDLRLAVSLNPSDSVAFAEMGRLSLYDGRPRDALLSFNRAVELDPLDFRLYSQICTTLGDLGRFDNAEIACERALQLQPDNAEVLDGLTWLASSRGAIGDALRWNSESLKFAPDDFELYWTRAELYSTLGLAALARESVEKGRIASKDNETADVALGGVAYLEGGTERLRGHLTATRVDQSSHSAILLEAAYLRLLLNEPFMVKKIVNRALAAADYDPLVDTPWAARVGESTQLNLAVAELALGDRSAARARLDYLQGILDRMINSGVERHSTYELRAKIEALRGDADAAMDDLRKASTLGWRRIWWAQQEPYFASLRSRSDFQLLASQINQSNEQLIAKLKIVDTSSSSKSRQSNQ